MQTIFTLKLITYLDSQTKFRITVLLISYYIYIYIYNHNLNLKVEVLSIYMELQE
jgi:hypothetical protein